MSTLGSIINQTDLDYLTVEMPADDPKSGSIAHYLANLFLLTLKWFNANVTLSRSRTLVFHLLFINQYLWADSRSWFGF